MSVLSGSLEGIISFGREIGRITNGFGGFSIAAEGNMSIKQCVERFLTVCWKWRCACNWS